MERGEGRSAELEIRNFIATHNFEGHEEEEIEDVVPLKRANLYINWAGILAKVRLMSSADRGWILLPSNHSRRHW